MMRCAVIGAGAWGTALADLLGRNGHEVALWAFESDVVEMVNARHANPRFLPGAVLSPRVCAHAGLERALDDAALVLLAAPSHVLRRLVQRSIRAIGAGVTLVVASKGIERGTLALMTQIVEEEAPHRPVVALSGPSFAAEVVARQPTAIVAASRDAAAALLAQQHLSNDHMRVYTHDDVTGVEVGGALKNVIAVATGIAEGLGLGYNPRAALITRGLAEITRLGVALGAHPATFAGLAGLGDLVLTCTGALSRNRALGAELARGSSLEDVLSTRETVAEGVFTTQSAHALAAREGIEMPIVAAVHRVLFEREPVRTAIDALMARELRPERDP
jgi:glycerol-3-phosphate dehydrogenase (NAD(P)+)